MPRDGGAVWCSSSREDPDAVRVAHGVVPRTGGAVVAGGRYVEEQETNASHQECPESSCQSRHRNLKPYVVRQRDQRARVPLCRS